MRPDTTVVFGLGAGAWYLNFVSTYGAAIVTTLAILTAAVTIALKVQTFIINNRKARREREARAEQETRRGRTRKRARRST